MTIGGLPDLRHPQINVTSQSIEVTVPIEKVKDTQRYTYYIVSVDGFHYHGAFAGAGKGQYIVDTGTVQTLMGEKEAKRINALFDPPAHYDKEVGAYVVPCTASAPVFGVEIGRRIAIQQWTVTLM